LCSVLRSNTLGLPFEGPYFFVYEPFISFELNLGPQFFALSKIYTSLNVVDSPFV